MSSLPGSGSVPSSVLSNSGNTTENDRKRRDNINDKIQELLAIIPPDFFQDYYRRKDSGDSDAGGTPGAAAMGMKVKGTGTKDGRPNKGQILTQAVEYITHLQGQVDSKNREEVELILKVKDLSKETGVIVNDINLENTSAEVALARIGVGPLAGTVDDYYGEKAQKNNNFEYGGYDEYGDGS
ncbi:LAFE_0E03070g1_1 [Lachancea fermentati]|uniref:LAFE_0E03070g1_1 n=1 Tax=Lachancea fermentati TaxID=4955 RepID=A0A1G4MCK7_LACFM|nr:LAFE_0E03070g1_1 [Lachancea fermentati]